MTDILIATVLGLGYFFVGYLFGHLHATKTDFKEFVDETGQKIQIEKSKLFDPPTPSLPTGRIRPKTPQEIYKRQLNPERREAIEETRKTLDDIPDLVAAKELLQAMKKEEYGQV